MQNKVCSKCGIERDISEFTKNSQKKDGLHPSCKECYKNFYKKNKDLILTRNKLWKTNNPEIKKQADINYRLNNPLQRRKSDKIYREKNSEIIKLRKKIWRDNNPNYHNEYEKNRKETDSLFKLTKILRLRFYHILKNKNLNKETKTFEIVGCTPEFLKNYIENKFSEGMSWDLMGQHIHIDHIIPLSSAKTKEELYKLCHYTNLQPLWATDNLKKSNKII
jgi:hypothetical protein